MVYVTKKYGSLGLCIDYWKLNNKIVPDKQPIPKMQDVLDIWVGKNGSQR